MTKFDKIQPTPYSPTDTAETTAIALLEGLLDKVHVKADLRKRDKVPNIDGSFELADENQHPEGVLSVQVKPLAAVEGQVKSFPCKVGFLAYCARSTVPVLLIGVNTKSKQAHWLHVSRQLLATLDIDGDQEAKSLRFPDENLIDGSNHSYIEKWRAICKDYRHKLIFFDELAAERDALGKELTAVRAVFGALGDVTSPEFAPIQEFLDELNQQLGSTFLIVKERLYPGVRRLGMAYTRLSSNGLSYALFPIVTGENELEIRKLPPGSGRKLLEEGVSLRSGPRRVGQVRSSGESLILSAPRKAAMATLGEWVTDLIRSKGLRLENELLAREVIFTAVDRLHDALGLPTKDEYPISELTDAFEHYLPLWTERALELLCTDHVIPPYLFGSGEWIDLEALLMFTPTERRAELDAAVRSDLSEQRLPQLPVPIGAQTAMLGVVRRQLKYLRHANVPSVHRLYLRPDRVPRTTFARMHDLWTDEAARDNFRLVFGNVLAVYDEVVKLNFPRLVSDLRFFRDFSRKILILRRVHTDFGTPWGLEQYELAGDAPGQGQMQILFEDSASYLASVNFDSDEVELEGQRYTVVGCRESLLAMNFNAHPLLDTVMTEIQDRFSAFLERCVEDEQWLF